MPPHLPHINKQNHRNTTRFAYSYKISIAPRFLIYRYKDDKPYPWNIEDSSFILYPEAANQTIYTRNVATADTGVYKCVLRNETHKTEHQVELKIQGNYKLENYN